MLNSIMPNAEVISFLTSETLTTGQVAGLLGVTKKALADLRVKRNGPPYVMLRRGIVRYPRQGLETFLRTRLQSAVAATGKRRMAHGGAR